MTGAASLFHRFLSFLVLLLFLAAITFFPGNGCNGNGSSTETTGTPDTPPSQIPQITLVLTASGFSNPSHINNAGDGSNRLFIAEQRGIIRIIKNGSVLPTPFLDISSIVRSTYSEQGLFGVVFPPGYAGKQYFYVDYTGNQGSAGDTFISRYFLTANADIADPATEQQVITIAQPFVNHNGGQPAFGPDGYLYIGMGDGGGGGDPQGNAQDPGSLLGKILRIDVEPIRNPYAIPPDNPFIHTAGHRPEIWALGLRNPWRFSFDRQTGDLYIADVGQGAYEEVNVQPASGRGGENYGWNILEGLHCYNAPSCDATGMTPPVAEYATHSAGNCSVTGGFVYRGPEFSSLKGIYIYGDFCSGRIWGLRRNGGAWENKLMLDSDLAISTFGEDEGGNLYVADYNSGGIYKIIVP